MLQLPRKRKPSRESVSQGLLNRGWSGLKRAFGIFWKRKVLVIILFCVLCLLFNIYFYLRSNHTATATISLDYEEASEGLTPSKTRFNIYEIQSTEVMQRLIGYAGLEGKITPDELSRCISVRTAYDKNVSGRVDYITTSYTVRFTRPDSISERTASAMLTLLSKAYREFFVAHYGVNHSILSFDIENLKFNDEYLMTIDLLELKCNQLGQYVRLLLRDNKNYRDPDTGVTFSDLEQRINNFLNYDLARLRSYIIESGIAADKPNLDSMLDYKIRMDRLAYSNLMAAYDEDNAGISMYDPAMSSIVLIPTQDASLQYYMSRTKTGMDSMAVDADLQLAGAMEKLKRIEYSSYLIEKMDAKGSTEAQRQKADRMIREMGAALEALASDIRRMDKSFTSYKARNYLTFRSSEARLMSRIQPVNSVLGACLVLGLAFCVLFLRGFLAGKEVGRS